MTVSDFSMYLKKAKEDLVVVQKLQNDLEVADATWGFHAHQTIEKLIKALLTKDGIEFPKSHDLVFLMELLPEKRLSLFQSIETYCEILNPFAVTLRYDDNIEIALDRPLIYGLLANLFNQIATK